MTPERAVSVVMPTYNGASYLAETVRSVCEQTRRPDELVIVDDRSSDLSVAIAVDVCERFGMQYRVHSRTDNSGGPVAPLNEGVALAKGPWIALIDQDDLWTSDRLERLFGAIREHPCRTALLFNDVDVFDGDDVLDRPSADAASLTVSGRSGPSGGVIDPPKAYAYLLMQRNFVHTASNMVFNKSAWMTLGGFDVRYRVCWDVEFLLRAVCRVETLYVPGVLTRHRSHGMSLSRSSRVESREMTELRDLHLSHPGLAIDLASLKRRVASEWWDSAYEAGRRGDRPAFWRAWRRSWLLGHPRSRLLGLALKLPAYLAAMSADRRVS